MWNLYILSKELIKLQLLLATAVHKGDSFNNLLYFQINSTWSGQMFFVNVSSHCSTENW